ncbi:MAG: phytanoyl-CoA dioxygenase family protein [Bryobacterales bacterium]
MGFERFQRDGYLVVRELLNTEEVGLLSDIARVDRDLVQQKIVRRDGEGGNTELTVVNDLPEDTIYGAIVRSELIVRPMEKFLGGEVYHYHHKMILKQKQTGGAWAWHQDYGYWYSNGCLFPDMASCMIAVDRATKENGCLQVLAGSHHMGRIDHVTVGTQTGADPERMEHILPKFERVYVEPRARRRGVLPLEPAASLRPEHLGSSALGVHLLLQRGAEQSLQEAPPPMLRAARRLAA